MYSERVNSGNLVRRPPGIAPTVTGVDSPSLSECIYRLPVSVRLYSVSVRFIMLLLVVALIVPALGARPGFTDTGTIEWRDCGVGDSWVSMKQFDISPTPLKLPGDITVSFDGTISHDLTDQVTFDVLMEKKLLGIFIKVPCQSDVGTCHYTDPCHCLNTFKLQGTCPPQLTANGLPCTCPFSLDRLHLPPSKLTITNICDAWKFALEDTEYHIKITLNDKTTMQLRGCLEAYLTIDV